MTRYEPGGILLLVFPFSDAGGAKQRPALVILDTGDADMLVARITTQRYRSDFDVDVTRWREAGLLGPSVVRLHKLATVAKSLIRQSLGSLQQSDRQAVGNAFRRVYCL